MRAILRSLARFAKQDDGPTAVEYAAMLALIICICMAAIYSLGQNSNSAYKKVGTAIQGPLSGGGPAPAP